MLAVMIINTNQWASFYMIGTSVMKELRLSLKIVLALPVYGKLESQTLHSMRYTA